MRKLGLVVLALLLAVAVLPAAGASAEDLGKSMLGALEDSVKELGAAFDIVKEKIEASGDAATTDILEWLAKISAGFETIQAHLEADAGELTEEAKSDLNAAISNIHAGLERLQAGALDTVEDADGKLQNAMDAAQASADVIEFYLALVSFEIKEDVKGKVQGALDDVNSAVADLTAKLDEIKHDAVARVKSDLNAMGDKFESIKSFVETGMSEITDQIKLNTAEAVANIRAGIRDAKAQLEAIGNDLGKQIAGFADQVESGFNHLISFFK